MRLLIGSGIVATLALSTACTFVTQSDIEERKACLDIDGDGAPQEYGSASCTAEDIAALGLSTTEVDCDDNDPRRAPHFEEVAYDGIDNDCDANLEDLLDIDGDGYPGITPSQYDQIEGAEWPTGLSTSLDCNDEDEEIYPNSPFEVPYDGVDTDCDRGADYDADGDGFVPDINPLTGAAHDPPYAGSLPSGDCNDNAPNVYPEAPSDLPYDGVDTNCDCVNDFDDDGDGFMWDEDNNLSNYENFINTYNCVVPNPTWGDCNDNSNTEYPGAPELWYDGIDQDCGNDDDYDQDGDGVALAQDCNDEDITVFPAALERLGDNVDQDCFGGPDIASFQKLSADWTRPRRPEVGFNGIDYVMFTGAEYWFDNSGSGALEYPGHAFYFDAADPFAGQQSKKTWTGAAPGAQTIDELAEVMDVEYTNDGSGEVYLGFYFYRGSQNLRTLAVRKMYPSGTSYAFAPPAISQTSWAAGSEPANPSPDDIDVQISPTSGHAFVVGCANTNATYSVFMAHDPEANNGGGQNVATGANLSVGSQACVLEMANPDSDAVAFLEYTDAMSTYIGPFPYYLPQTLGGSFSAADTSLGWSWDGIELDVVNEQGGVTAYYDGAAGRTSVRTATAEYAISNLDGAVVKDIDAHVHPDTGDLYIVAVTADRGAADADSLDDLVIVYGPAGGPYSEATVPMESATLQPRSASIYADATVIWVAFAMWDTATATEADDVAWMMFEP